MRNRSSLPAALRELAILRVAVLNRASSLFYEAELGSFATRSAAEARWKQLVATNRLAGIDPAYAGVTSGT